MPDLTQYAYLANDLVLEGLYENIITESMLAPFLQFQTFSGNSLKYNRESALPTSSSHTVGDIWTDTEPTFNQKTASLTEIGVQSPLSRYALQTRGNVQDQEAVLFLTMSKSLVRKIEDLVITGEPEAVSTEIEGLDSLCRSETRMMAMDDGVVDGAGAAETELTPDRLDAMIDMIPGEADALMMNKLMRRKLMSICRASSMSGVMGTIEQFGRRITTYSDLPIVINDFITNAETYNDSSTWPSSTATTIFALKFGEEKQGYTIIHNGDVLTPDIQRLGIKTDKNENLYRMVVYIQTLTYSAKMIAALGGIDSTA